jgi:preprotein translocase subunit SecA
MLKNFVKLFSGDPTKKTVQKLGSLVEQINGLEPEFEPLTDDALRAKTDEFRARIKELLGNVDGLEDAEQFKAEQEALFEILPEAFAAVREASKRTIGLRHYDVQMIGGATLHRGEIAEMRTGEGKTLVATLPLYLNAIMGRGAHLITVNDYLARRDARWMAPIFNMLGLSVGVLQMAAATENGKKAFIVDFERESPHEDQQHLRLVDRVEAYAADITYGTNAEFGFDYLRDNMTMRLDARVQRGHHFAIVDEVDNVLIDEARTPLIISGPASGDLDWYGKMAQVVRQVKPEYVEINEKDRNVSLTDVGLAYVEQLLGQTLLDPDRPEDLTPEQARLTGYLEQALRAQFLFHRNKEYLVQGGKVVIVDEFTGRQMPGRRWSDGLHQAVEAKEGVKVEAENVTYATITLQNYFRMYKKLAGMTGTALTEAEEFDKIYKLEVAPIPTNLEYSALRANAQLVEKKAKDEEGYQYTYYTAINDESGRIFYRRKDYPDVIYRTQETKLRAIVQELVRYHVLGRPILLGTTSVDLSEKISGRMRAEPVRRLAQVLLVRNAWMAANDREEDGRLIPELVPFNGPLETLRPDDMRKFISPFGLASINPEDPANLETLRGIFHLEAKYADRLKSVLQAGIPHHVLNARKHTEESQIIAGAGAFGAVTIATNMAGRGVDIKLGGELAEEVISAVHRVLRRAGVTDPYDMTLEERRQALLKADPALHGIYESEVKLFLQYFDEMEAVKALGGLHVIGSERHESRRIDNQLRGRAARQGDPGSSRFYLSLEDELMRIQGGSQVSGLMERLKVDDSLPLEVRLVGNVIEQSQHRIEGANFDVRKHLLEYDDVLNKQRAQIYSQRDRIFVKEDLHEDVMEMLTAEVEKRVETGLADEEGPWKLIAWLEQVQPPFLADGRMFPTFGLSLLRDEISASGRDVPTAMLDLVQQAVEAEQAHTLRAIETSIEKTGESLESQISDRVDALDAYFQGLRDQEETPRPQKMLEELSNLARMQLKLSNEQMRALGDDPASLKEDIQDMTSAQLTRLYADRLVLGIENRIGDSLGEKIKAEDWDEVGDQISAAARATLERQHEKLVGANGQIARDIAAFSSREGEDKDTSTLRLLLSLTQSTRPIFNQRTHKQEKQLYQRFNYVFLAAQLLDGREADALVDEVLEHLDRAEQALQIAWGQGEYNRISANAQRLADFGPAAKIAFGEDRLNGTASALGAEERRTLIEELGRYVLNEVHRQLLLGAITELWVDYLTRVESLRVSIGLEAYAQRDPLVQYKSKASELYRQLLSDIRGQVISRVFAYQPRRIEITPVETSEAPASPEAEDEGGEDASGGKKRKRKRH